MMTQDLTRLTIGALLHDIGKLKQRAGLDEDSGKTHSQIGYEWLRDNFGEGLIADIAKNHHASQNETWQTNFNLIVCEADNLAASERKSIDESLGTDQKWQREILLACDFLRVQLDEKRENQKHQPRYWPLKPLGGWISPVEEEKSRDPDAYKKLWRGFDEEFQILHSNNNHHNIRVLLHLLEKYTSYVPSFTLQFLSPDADASFRQHVDVSLFDHSRVTAAAASCLYHFHRNNDPQRWERGELIKEEILRDWDDTSHTPFLLVGGDISGIQKFIYTISSKAALKSLKGRSFFLELLCEYITDRIQEALSLPPTNVIFSGGGHFYILAPNTGWAVKALQEVREEVNAYLFEAFNASLMLALEWVPMAKRDFRHASDTWAQLAQKLEEAKRHKWKHRLNDLLSSPVPPHQDCLTESCEVCWREDAGLSGQDPRACPTCRQQFLFGQALQRVYRNIQREKGLIPVIEVWQSPTSEDCLKIGMGASARFYQVSQWHTKMGDLQETDGLLSRYLVNQWDISAFQGPMDRPLVAGIYHHPGFEDLENLVQNGFGIDRAAVLRMDVDRLGEIFSRGLPTEERTFSRMASLSRNLALFFQYHINGILNPNGQNGYEGLPRIDSSGRARGGRSLMRNLSVVYSGGDDLFLLGQWLDVLEASYDIRAAFETYTGGNTITISGGYALGDHHHPVYRFADDSERSLKKAKETGRNAFGIVQHTFPWQDAMKVKELVLHAYLPLLETQNDVLSVPPGSVSRGFFYRLLALVKDTKEKGVLVLPKVAYLAGRNAPSSDWLTKRQNAQRAWSTLKNELFKMPEPMHLEKIKCATAWIIMMMRKGGRQ